MLRVRVLVRPSLAAGARCRHDRRGASLRETASIEVVPRRVRTAEFDRGPSRASAASRPQLEGTTARRRSAGASTSADLG